MKKGRNEMKAVVFGIVLIFLFGAVTPVLSSLPRSSFEEETPTLQGNDTISLKSDDTTSIQDDKKYDTLVELNDDDGGVVPFDTPQTFYEACDYWYKKPATYAQLITWYKNLEQNYSNYIEVWKANEMYGLGQIPNQNYAFYMVRITNESTGLHKPEVLFTLNIHGNEYVGSIGGYWFTDWLMRHAFHPDYQDSQSEWLRWLIDNREIYLVPSMNPDGYDDNRRTDYYGSDLNRDFDHSQANPWDAINTQVLRRFVDNHTIRINIDFHSGYRGFPYPWSNTGYRSTMIATSPISGRTYNGQCPPDFYFLDACFLRAGSYIGNPSGQGAFTSSNIGPWTHTLGYDADGTSCDWLYGADVISNPAEDPYVNDEIYGNYPGSGILATLIEFGSHTFCANEINYGNDTTDKLGAEVRRAMLHQIDIAQPYLRWQSGTIEDGSTVDLEETLMFSWQVNGSLVVDDTYMQWGMHPDPINYPEYTTYEYDENTGNWYGGTGWNSAVNGNTDGITYTETLSITTPGDYYFVAKAKVDQIYKNVIYPGEYGNTSYLRIIKERTDESFYEEINGTDGVEVVQGQLWWYSPVIHVRVGEFVNQKLITVNHTRVMGNLTDFPLLLSIDADSELAAACQEDGGDIRFLASNGTKLDHEIELFNKSTGQLIAWIRIPYLSSTVDTTLFMQYGDESSPNQQNPSGVWGSSYRGVWHFSESVVDSTMYENDGTNHGSTDTFGRIGNARYFDGNDYITAPAHHLGANHSWTASLWFKSNSTSTMLYHYLLSTGGYQANDAVNVYYNNNDVAYLPLTEVRALMDDHDGDAVQFLQYGGGAPKDIWHLVHVTWDAPSHTFMLFVNGSVVNQSVNPDTDSGGGTTNPLHIGTRTDLNSQRFHLGWIDELRISTLTKNASWIATEYNNQHSPGTFCTVGYSMFPQSPILQNQYPVHAATNIPRNPVLSVSVTDYQGDTMNLLFRTNASGIWQTIGTYTDIGNGTYTQPCSLFNTYNTTYYWSVHVFDGAFWTNRTSFFTTEQAPPEWWNTSWAYRKKITIDHTKITEDLIYFPVLISLETDADLSAHAQSDGDDIVFTDYTEYGNQLHHEIELYNTTDGRLVAWVNVPLVSSLEDTSLFIYYGNPTCNNQENPSDVWDEDYVAVWHLRENPGTAGASGIKDSTVYQNHGTALGGMTIADQVAGITGFGIDFDGSNDVIRIDNSNTLGHILDFTTGPFTLEAWFNTPSTTDQGTLISKRDGTSLDQYQFFLQPELQFRANTEYGAGTDTVSPNTWHYAAVVVDESNWPDIYRNALMKPWSDKVGSRPYDFVHRDVNVSIGARWDNYPTTGFRFTGVMDEVRVSKSVRNQSWLSACYNNYMNPVSFYSVDFEQAGNGAPSVRNETPIDGSSGVIRNPVLSVELFDWQEDLMDITFKTNASGTWQDIGTNMSVGNGRYSQYTTNMNSYYTRYWWSVHVSDQGSGNWTNRTFSFMTMDNKPLISDPSPANAEENVGGNPLLSVFVLDSQGYAMTVIFRSNQSGLWQDLGVYENVESGRVSHQTVDMTSMNTRYWWSVNVSDVSGNWSNETFSFTTSDQLLKLKWTVSNLQYMNRGVLLADLNGNGRTEVVQIHGRTVIALDGQDGQLLWSHYDSGITPPTGTDSARLEIADLNNDATPDVIVPLTRGVLALDGATGNRLWRLTGLSGSVIYSSPVVFDIEGYGYPYVYIPVQDVVEPLEGTLNKISHDGKLLKSVWAYRPCAGGLSLADTNFDGKFEIIVGDRNYGGGIGLASFDADDLSMNWNVMAFQMNSAIPPVADATNDGILDIIVAMQNSPRGFAVVDTNGNVLKSEWGIAMGGHGLSATVHDFDEDGDLEMIFSCDFEGGIYDIVVWNLNPAHWGEKARINAGDLRFSPQLADITGDGQLEMIAASSTRLRIYNRTYDMIYEFSGLSNELMFPTLNDIDGDGLFELVITSSAGKIYAFETFSPVPDPAPRSEVEFYSEYRRGVAEYVERPGLTYPMQRDEYPANNSVRINPNPVLSAWVWDYQWDEFNITISTNASGSWENLATYTNIGRYPNQTITGNAWGRYSAETTSMTEPNTTYYWQISAVDVKGNSFEKTYQFTTADVVPLVMDPSPLNGTTAVPLSLSQLRISLMDLQGDHMNYTVETSPFIGSSSGTLVSNGTYVTTVDGLQYNTVYTWFVNVTDGQHWTNSTYQFTTRPSPGVWWNTNWLYRKEIIINNTKIMGTLTNFPVLIDLTSDPDLVAWAQLDAGDLVFTNYERQVLNHEIELYNSNTGRLVAWVNVTSISPISTIILYMYYGNPFATFGSPFQDPTGVWDSGFVSVYHKREDTTTHTYDSTIHAKHGLFTGLNLPTTVTGMMGDAQEYDGSSDYVTLPLLSSSNTFTFSTWVRLDETTSTRHIFGNDAGTNWRNTVHNSNWYTRRSGSTIRDDLAMPVLSTGVWTYLTFVYDGSGAQDSKTIYKDGDIVSTKSPTTHGAGSIGAGIDLSQLGHGGDGIYFDGVMDEVRISNVVRSSAWITTEYNNQVDPGTFYTVGAHETGAPVVSDESPMAGATGQERNPRLSIYVQDPQGDLMNVYFRSNASGTWQTIGSNLSVSDGMYSQKPMNMNNYLTTYYWSANCTDGVFWVNRTYSFTTRIQPDAWWNMDWLYRKELVIDHTLVAGNLSYFPILITLPSDVDLATYAQDDGDDLVFTNSLGVTLSHEIELFDGATGQLFVWVCVPSLSDVVNTSLFLYYGNAWCESQQDPAGVWDADYVAVWHLNEDPGVVGPGGIKDSTAYLNNGTALGDMTSVNQVDGKIGYAIDFDGVNDVIRIDGSNVVGHSLDFTSGPFTIEAWFRIRTTSDPGTIVSKRDGTTLDQYQFYLQPNLRIRANSEYGGGTDTVPINTWHYGAVVVNNTNWPETYRNAVQKPWVNNAGSRPYNFVHRNVNVSIGARWENYPTTAFPFKGIIDEVRISKTNRSDDWLLTSYNNQNNPSMFYTLKDQEEAPEENQPPVAEFMYTPSAPTTETMVYFFSTSYDVDGLIVNWSWDFADGYIAFGEQVTHQFTTAGSYAVNLTVLDNEGATSSVEQMVLVDAAGEVWNVTMLLSESGGMMDSVGFGEAVNASAGQDQYDVPKPGTPPPAPYLTGWFDAGLSEPYNRLWWDYRPYPGSYTVWNLSVQWVPVDYISPTVVTLSWDPSDLVECEYPSVTLVNVDSGAMVDMRATSLYVFNASALILYEFLIIGSSEIELPVTNLSQTWNLVSIPFNLSVAKSELQVRWNGSVYSWAEALSAGLVLDFMYGWNRSGQSYGLHNVLTPGYGYWMYAYQSCEVFIVSTVLPPETDRITGLLMQWNMVGFPSLVPCPKQNFVVQYDGVDYNWTQATTEQNPTGSPLILGFIYNWSRAGQSYQLSDFLNPGYAYWVYAYQNCMLKKE